MTNKYWIKSPYRVKESLERKEKIDFTPPEIKDGEIISFEKIDGKVVIESSVSGLSIVLLALTNVNTETYQLKLRGSDETN